MCVCVCVCMCVQYIPIVSSLCKVYSYGMRQDLASYGNKSDDRQSSIATM